MAPGEDPETGWLEWKAEWDRIGHEWYQLLTLSPHLGKHVRRALEGMREDLTWARSELERLGLRPPAGTT